MLHRLTRDELLWFDFKLLLNEICNLFCKTSSLQREIVQQLGHEVMSQKTGEPVAVDRLA